jgi:hypothetical protein
MWRIARSAEHVHVAPEAAAALNPTSLGTLVRGAVCSYEDFHEPFDSAEVLCLSRV